ncbi:MAG: hypothetical protein JWO85_2592 [Candidatus Eremiobacteraeota bacterium]|nr:hypothetical protein [Candidatus Eremiobacteraeota bacterium]
MSESNSDREPPGFAPTDKIAPYGGISSAFFRLVGLGDVLFISNESRLRDIRDSAASGTPMDALYARIRELYGVDVSGLDLLVDIFEQIQSGPVYQEWLKSQQ